MHLLAESWPAAMAFPALLTAARVRAGRLVESDPARLLERMREYAPAEGGERLMGRTHR
jgi:hypothetical protein